MNPPLTFQQQSLWKLMRTHPDWQCSVAYAFCLKGELSIALLEGSLGEVMRRHGSLRTTVVTVEEAPTLAIGESQGCRFDVVSLVGQSREALAENARRLFAQFSARIVDPAAGPLLNTSLLKLSKREHWLLMSIHRLAADCFSAEQLFQELWSLYRELAQGQPSPFASDPPQYGDYALWQQTQGREWLQRHEDYWEKRLHGAASIQWPVDSGPPGAERGVMGTMSRHFGDELSAGLQSFARRTRSLSAMVMLSAYVAVVWRWCGQRDFILPFNVAGRQSDHKLVVGYFSHILYLRIELTGQETFSELLSLVSNEFFRALSHQDFGRQATERPELLAGAFCQWVPWHLGVAPNASAPAAPQELVVERLPLSAFGQGLSILPPGMVDVDLTFFDTAEGIYAQGVYRADRFTSSTAEHLLSDLHAALKLFVRNPSAAVRTVLEESCCRKISSRAEWICAGRAGF
jgi:hypothetical protein